MGTWTMELAEKLGDGNTSSHDASSPSLPLICLRGVLSSYLLDPEKRKHRDLYQPTNITTNSGLLYHTSAFLVSFTPYSLSYQNIRPCFPQTTPYLLSELTISHPSWSGSSGLFSLWGSPTLSPRSLSPSLVHTPPSSPSTSCPSCFLCHTIHRIIIPQASTFIHWFFIKPREELEGKRREYELPPVES